ncbi:hypothetical protein JXB41_05750 [Candidatus Woesearchaeota archaeon]|nr:hypothetical protein [Candidatus Woesearchaeota archaeon]
MGKGNRGKKTTKKEIWEQIDEDNEKRGARLGRRRHKRKRKVIQNYLSSMFQGLSQDYSKYFAEKIDYSVFDEYDLDRVGILAERNDVTRQELTDLLYGRLFPDAREKNPLVTEPVQRNFYGLLGFYSIPYGDSQKKGIILKIGESFFEQYDALENAIMDYSIKGEKTIRQETEEMIKQDISIDAPLIRLYNAVHYLANPPV